MAIGDAGRLIALGDAMSWWRAAPSLRSTVCSMAGFAAARALSDWLQ